MSDGEKLGLGVHNFDSSKWNAFTLYENQNEKKSNWIESKVKWLLIVQWQTILHIHLLFICY